MLSQNWHAFLTSCPTTKAGNKNSTAFTTAWSTLTANKVKLVTISNDDTLVVIAVNANNKVVVLHSFKNLGGTLLYPTNKFACLVGLGRVISTVIANKASLLFPLDITAPTYNVIISCLDVQEISALVPPVQVNNDPNSF